MTWLRNNASARRYLRGLARGEIPLTHDGLHDLPSWRTAAHLRDLLPSRSRLMRLYGSSDVSFRAEQDDDGVVTEAESSAPPRFGQGRSRPGQGGRPARA